MQYSIEIEHLSHRFDGRNALQDISYQVREGEVFALLGPNGAGKTTTIRLLNGLYTPSQGYSRVLGYDPVSQGSQVRQETGVLTESNALYERLTARENLEFFGRLYGLTESLLLKRTAEILSFFALEKRADDRVSTYSKGMKQRLSLARALLNQPRILFLDEPTASLDPESTQQVHELIESLSRESDRTIFLCTHRLEEAERLADRVAILHEGKLLALGTLDELARQYTPGLWVDIELIKALEKADMLREVQGVLKIEYEEKKMRVQVAEEAVIPTLVNWLVNQNALILSINPRHVSLENIYFKFQAEAREGAK